MSYSKYVQVRTSMYWYVIPVLTCTSMYWYVLVPVRTILLDPVQVYKIPDATGLESPPQAGPTVGQIQPPGGNLSDSECYPS
jgi:hypothetical protein